MKMNMRTLFVCALTVIELIVAAPHAALAVDATAVKQVTDANDAFYKALLARDIKAMDAVWAKKSHAMYIGPYFALSKTVSVGHDAIMKSWEETFDVLSEISASISNVRVQTDGNRAWIASIENAEVRPKGGGQPLKFDTSVTHRFEKTKNVWLLVSRHAQSIPQQ
jgi:ketosteroid isomerase-like protein